MSPMYQKHLTKILSVTALAFGLTACSPRSESQTAGEKIDSAVERAEHAAENARHEAEGVIGAASDHLDEAMHATQEAAHDTLKAGRDLAITAKVTAALVADTELSALQIRADTKEGVVTLHGEVSSQAAKDRALELAKAVDGVIAVRNDITVK